MANERLRAAMLTRGLTPSAVAAEIGVDRKTVERWIAHDRPPYRQHRHAVAALVREDEAYLWPTAVSADERKAVAQSEVLEVFPHRSLVPPELWFQMFGRARAEIAVLVHAGIFLAENMRWHQLLRQAAANGVRVRIALGDPASPEVSRRGEEEEVGEGVAFKVREAMKLYRSLYAVEGIEFRSHCTTLHNSLYRADSEWLVNTQVYGISAPMTPVLHLKRIAAGTLVNTYEQSFEKVWAESAPLREVASGSR